MSIALHYSYRKIDHEAFCNQDEIPEESVEQVYLKACDLVQFPDWLMRLKNLTHINISCNAVNFVPSDIGSLTNLNYCDMSDNRLVHLTPSLFDLTNLKYLDVAGNFIEEIPTGETDSGGSRFKAIANQDSIFFLFHEHLHLIAPIFFFFLVLFSSCSNKKIEKLGAHQF